MMCRELKTKKREKNNTGSQAATDSANLEVWVLGASENIDQLVFGWNGREVGVNEPMHVQNVVGESTI